MHSVFKSIINLTGTANNTSNFLIFLQMILMLGFFASPAPHQHLVNKSYIILFFLCVWWFEKKLFFCCVDKIENNLSKWMPWMLTIIWVTLHWLRMTTKKKNWLFKPVNKNTTKTYVWIISRNFFKYIKNFVKSHNIFKQIIQYNFVQFHEFFQQYCHFFLNLGWVRKWRRSKYWRIPWLHRRRDWRTAPNGGRQSANIWSSNGRRIWILWIWSLQRISTGFE